MSQENPDRENGSSPSSRDPLESLEIPPGIDPRLLELWLFREREKTEKQERLGTKSGKRPGRKLTWLFAAYIGIVVMCLAIVLGWLQGKEPTEILQFTCWAFLFYTIFGFFVGLIAEYCITDSVETLLREILRRHEPSADAAPTNGTSTE